MAQKQASQPQVMSMSDAEILAAFVSLTQAAAQKGIPSIGDLHAHLGAPPPPYEVTISNTSAPPEVNRER